ncbi:hypothetical protein D5086_022161, partial [Populus alba]
LSETFRTSRGIKQQEQALHTLTRSKMGILKETLSLQHLLQSPQQGCKIWNMYWMYQHQTGLDCSCSSSPETKPEDFLEGQAIVFPLSIATVGVFKKSWPYRAYVDLLMLAGLPPVSVLSAIIDSRRNNQLGHASVAFLIWRFHV